MGVLSECVFVPVVIVAAKYNKSIILLLAKNQKNDN